jgi:transposase
VIPEKDDRTGHRARCGGRPPSFDAHDYQGRNVFEPAFNVFKQWRGPTTRTYELALTYRGAAVLGAINVWLKELLGDMP